MYLSPAGVHHLKDVVHVVHQGQELLVFIIISFPKDNGAYDVGDRAAQHEGYVKRCSCDFRKVTDYKKIPQRVVCLLNPTVGNLNSGCYWKYQITDSDTEGSSEENRTRSQNYYSFVMRSSWCMDQIHRNVIPC